MMDKQFDAIQRGDIEELMQNNVPEGRTLDYKLTLPGGRDGDKKEFAADISSFANASGGDLLFGVEEAQGVPVAIPGVTIADVDAEKLRLESIIRTGIQPHISGIRVRAIPGFPQGHVVLVRIPRSWASPHLVTHSGDFRFYTRHNTGKDRMDVSEIRTAFHLSETIPERMRRFRDDRLARVIARETPVPIINEAAYVVVHLLPLSSFRGYRGRRYNISFKRLASSSLQRRMDGM